MSNFVPALDTTQDYRGNVNAGGDSLLRNLVKKAIATAVVANATTTASISTSGCTENGLETILAELSGKGYSYTLSASSFTVTYPAA